MDTSDKMKAMYYEFVIERCNAKKTCKKDKEIDEFISSVQVSTW